MYRWLIENKWLVAALALCMLVVAAYFLGAIASSRAWQTFWVVTTLLGFVGGVCCMQAYLEKDTDKDC